ncbi:hypothetical protein GT354_50250, partial [Streptomyces sp. SID3343]|nr:hypothetical protein [Streptomyces sp. SID3343]
MSTSVSPFPWLALLIVLGLAGATRKLRSRVRELPVLGEEGDASDVSDASDASDAFEVSKAFDEGAEAVRADESHASHASDAWTVLAAVGVRVEPGTVRAAVAHAEREHLLLLDLVPGDLPSDHLLTLLGRLDPKKVRTDPLARGRGAGHALVVRTDVLARAGIDAAEQADLEPSELIALTAALKPYAAFETGHAVAPRLIALGSDPSRRKRWLRATGVPVWPNLVGGLGEAAAYTGACVTTPLWGAVAVLAMWLQPYAVAAGAVPVRPRDL